MLRMAAVAADSLRSAAQPAVGASPPEKSEPDLAPPAAEPVRGRAPTSASKAEVEKDRREREKARCNAVRIALDAVAKDGEAAVLRSLFSVTPAELQAHMSSLKGSRALSPDALCALRQVLAGKPAVACERPDGWDRACASPCAGCVEP